jgi:hypothetical protein
MKKRTGVLIVLTALLTAAIVFVVIYKTPGYTSFVIKSRPKQVQFYFFDENNCSLEGYLFVGNKLVGKTEDGLFNLSYEYYKENFDEGGEINLFGKLGGCYREELFFDKYWESFEIPEYYFLGDSLFKFKTTLSPHNPSRKELLGFIQPSNVRGELQDIKIKREDSLDDLSEINKYLNDKVSYVEDWDFNKEENYWQTPEETLEKGQGDCEDYSTSLLSLFLTYNNSLNCYNVIFSSHVTTMCYVGDYYIYYDQQRTELRKRIPDLNIETKPKLRALRQEYFQHYGIDESERAHYAFNEQRFIEFSNGEDFITWQASLTDKKPSLSVFNQLESELQGINITYSYPEEEIIELPTASPQLPTLSGFVEEYSTILLILGGTALLLIIILVVVILKR